MTDDQRWGPPGSLPPPSSTPAPQQVGQASRGWPDPASAWAQPAQPAPWAQQVYAAGAVQRAEFASPWLRLGCRLLEGLLVVVTLVIGWLVWAAVLAADGQTPAKKLLGLRVIRTDTGRPASWPWMVFMRGLVANWVAQLAIVFTLGILLFMPFWDRRNQNIWDKVSSCVVVHDPDGRLRNGISPAAIA